MLYVYIVLMAASLFGMLWCAKNQKKKANAQTYAFICLGVVFVCAIGILVDTGVFGGNSSEINRIIRNETIYAEAKAEIMAKYLSEKYSNSTALIIVDEQMDSNPTMKSSVEILKKNLKSIEVLGVEKLMMPQMDPENPMPMPYEEMINAEKYNEIFKNYKNAKLVINFANLPYNPEEIAKLAIWEMPEPRPKLVLLQGEVYNMKNPIRAGYIAGAIAMKGTIGDPMATPPSDPQEAFDARYLLVTPENVMKVESENPSIFAP